MRRATHDLLQQLDRPRPNLLVFWRSTFDSPFHRYSRDQAIADLDRDTWPARRGHRVIGYFIPTIAAGWHVDVNHR